MRNEPSNYVKRLSSSIHSVRNEESCVTILKISILNIELDTKFNARIFSSVAENKRKFNTN